MLVLGSLAQRSRHFRSCRHRPEPLTLDPVDLTQQLAHEIQAPLLSLELQLKRLIERVPGSELAESCLQEVAALQRLVVHVLELGVPPMTLHALDLTPVVERVTRRFQPMAAAREVSLSMRPGGVTFVGDANATERIVSNLLDNAIKFTSQNGKVEIITRSRGECVELEVRDNGVGVAADARERIFEPFYRADRDARGTGLGLAIATQLARAQNGSLRCESEPDRGSAFILTLPAVSS